MRLFLPVVRKTAIVSANRVRLDGIDLMTWPGNAQNRAVMHIKTRAAISENDD